MSDPLGFHRSFEAPEPGDALHLVLPQRGLARLLAFAGRSIDDVVNSPLARRELIHYFKLDRAVRHRVEVVELERQWNPLGRP